MSGPDPRSIVAAVAADHGLEPAELTSRRHFPYLVAARREAARRLFLETDLRLRQIGELLERDHSTVSGLLRGPW